MTLFVDYTFQKVPGGGAIMFDKELKHEQLEITNGDLFKVQDMDGRVVFKRIDEPSKNGYMHEQLDLFN